MLFQHCVERAESATRRAVLVLDHDHGDGRISEQLEELGATLVDARIHLLQHLRDLRAFSRAPRHPLDSGTGAGSRTIMAP